MARDNSDGPVTNAAQAMAKAIVIPAAALDQFFRGIAPAALSMPDRVRSAASRVVTPVFRLLVPVDRAVTPKLRRMMAALDRIVPSETLSSLVSGWRDDSRWRRD